jgi:hypothetical protein
MATQAQSITRAIEPPRTDETVRLRYRGDAPVIIPGPASGRLYRIDHDALEVAADRRDVSALVATGRFLRLSGKY